MRLYALLCGLMQTYAVVCGVIRSYAVLCADHGRWTLSEVFPPFLFVHSPNRPAKAWGSALSRGDRDKVYLTVGCQRMKRRSSSVTARSMTSAKAVRTRIPAITVFMSKVVSA